nr:F0F1 ATP synthase subunit B [Romeria gracilis]
MFIEAFALLASEVAPELASESEGFGLSFDLLESNLVNLIIVIGVLIYFGRGFLGKKLAERRAEIEAAIKEAEARQKKASASLAEQQQKLQQAQNQAKQIRAEAETNAKSAREAILQQAAKDVERMKAAAQQDMSSQEDRVMRELRQRVSAMAMERVETRLSDVLNDEIQNKLIDQSIALIGDR